MAEISREAFDALCDRLAKMATDQGKLIELGWLSYRRHFMPPDGGSAHVIDTRRAFMAGAEHLFASMMGILDPDAEPTEADMRRMDMIDQELRPVREELKAFLRKRSN